MCGTNSTLSGKSWELGVPPDCLVPCQGWGLFQECVSAFPTCFDVGIFSVTQCVGVTQLVSGFLSERIDLFSSEHSVYPWEEGNSGASYVAILVQSPFKSSLYI